MAKGALNMVVDSSALIAILLGEPDADRFARAIAGDPKRLTSSVSALETAIVIEAKKGEPGSRELDLLFHRTGIQVVPFDADQVDVARFAWRTYGKGRHPASLNLGDCCTYALSKSSHEPILFKGDDFAKTDALAVHMS
jgi:ribonuclease VapC